MKTNDRPSDIAVTIDALRRHARIGVVRSGRGGAAPRVFSPDGRAAVEADDIVVARVYHVDDLLDIHLSGDLAGLDWTVGSILDVIRRASARRGQPAPPVSVLIHGTPGVSIPIVVHALAVRLEAELVQLFASTVVPNSNGGSQPIVAPAVNQARGRRSSVLYIDEIDTLVTNDRRDVKRQRALNDLIGEALRPVYGRVPVVVARYAGREHPPASLVNRFDHVCRVTDGKSEKSQVSMHDRAADRPVQIVRRRIRRSGGDAAVPHSSVDYPAA
jgi:hypothetical protein